MPGPDLSVGGYQLRVSVTHRRAAHWPCEPAPRFPHLPVGDVDVDGVLVVQQPADVRHGCIQQAVLVPQAPPLLAAWQRAGVRQRRDLRQLQVAWGKGDNWFNNV